MKIACDPAKALAIVADLDHDAGYPRAALASDRRGGGIHVPLELAGTTTFASIDVDKGAASIDVPADKAQVIAAKFGIALIDVVAVESAEVIP